MLRGKRKHLCDFSMEVGWTARLSGGGELRGSLQVADLSADRDYEVGEVAVRLLNGKKPSGALPQPLQELFNKEVASEKGALRKAIHEQLMRFCDELKTK